MEDIFVPSTWKRLAAFFVDQIVMILFYLPFAGKMFQAVFTEEEVYLSLVQLLVFFMVPAIYEFVFLVIMQATPGKWLFGLKVVPQNNPFSPLHITQCIMRPFVSRLSFFFGWAIYAVAFFRYDRTHLADWVAETRVVQFKPRPHRATIRWIAGSFFVLCYIYEGLVYSNSILSQIDWKNKQVELRNVVNFDQSVDFQFDDFDDEE
ncbi:MAG: RDD family protein [Bdellovibrio sp.]|nr:RDD family protein [Bdellovibrio sp.]